MGLPLSVVSSWLIYRGMVAGGGFQLQFLFPWSSLVLSALGVFLVVLITMLYATRKIKKKILSMDCGMTWPDESGAAKTDFWNQRGRSRRRHDEQGRKPA